ERRAEVVGAPLVRRARVERDAHTQLRAVTPCRTGERTLESGGGRKRRGRVGERGAHAVPSVLEEPAAAVGDRGARDRIMTGERVRHRGGGAPPEAGGAPDGGGGDRHG